MLDAGGGIFSVVLSARRCAELRLPEQEGRGEAGRRIAASIDARVGDDDRDLGGRAGTHRAGRRRPGDATLGPRRPRPRAAADRRRRRRLRRPRRARGGPRPDPPGAGGSAAAICAILDRHGATATAAEVRGRAAARGLPLVTVTEVAARRIAAERPLRALGRRRVVTHHGAFTAVSFGNAVTGEAHAALVRGAVEGRTEVPLAIRSSSPVDDLLATLEPSGESSLAQVLRALRPRRGRGPDPPPRFRRRRPAGPGSRRRHAGRARPGLGPAARPGAGGAAARARDRGCPPPQRPPTAHPPPGRLWRLRLRSRHCGVARVGGG